MATDTQSPAPAGWTALRGRLLILSAAVLWSTSGLFVKSLGGDLPPTTIALYRCVSAGLMLALIVGGRRVSLTWQPAMWMMMVSFAAMNYFFIAAMSWTTAANCIFLQYTAPLWMALASVFILKEPADAKNFWLLAGGMIGIVIILVGQNQPDATQQWGMFFALLSGLTYASVAIFLRLLRAHDALWLATLNHLAAGLVMAVIIALHFAWDGHGQLIPSGKQLAWLTLFGTCQMALPYVLFGLGLRDISPQEAGLIALTEPLLNPTWTFLINDEVPDPATLVGGGVLLTMLLLRYIPTRRSPVFAKGPVQTDERIARDTTG